MYSNIVHDVDDYTSASSVAVNSAGVLFVALVVNPPDPTKDGIPENQYCVIKRIDPVTKSNTPVKYLFARDSRAMIVAEGADPNSDSGKYGNVSIAIHGSDIYIVLEIRYEGVNKQRWGILKGIAV